MRHYLLLTYLRKAQTEAIHSHNLSRACLPDLDSTVMNRSGCQEGSAKGYNPRRPGRKSVHPLLAFVADIRMVANYPKSVIRNHRMRAGRKRTVIKSLSSFNPLRHENVNDQDEGQSNCRLYFLENRTINHFPVFEKNLVRSRRFSRVQKKIFLSTREKILEYRKIFSRVLSKKFLSTERFLREYSRIFSRNEGFYMRAVGEIV
jgi:hypothetical protein